MSKTTLVSKKIIAVLTVMVGGIVSIHTAHALSPTRALNREERREAVQEKKDSILERAKNIVKERLKKQLKGTLVTIAGPVLTVQKDEQTFTVTTTQQTEFKRKFGGTSSLSELSPNDQLLIVGNRVKKEDGTVSSTEMEAAYIRNMSIQRRFAVFTGEVTAKTSSSLTLKTGGRGVQTVYTTSKTEYKLKNRLITFGDIQIGDKVVVKGELWDRVNDKIDAKTILKLNTQKPSISPSPTASKED